MVISFFFFFPSYFVKKKTSNVVCFFPARYHHSFRFFFAVCLSIKMIPEGNAVLVFIYFYFGEEKVDRFRARIPVMNERPWGRGWAKKDL